LVQAAAGGNGILKIPSYFNTYNLSEVTIYGTLLALVGLCGLAVYSLRRGITIEERNWTIWLVVAFVGVWAAWGSYTHVGVIFHLIPLFKNTRLQSRNFVLVNLAGSMALGRLLQLVEDGDWRRAGLDGRRRWLTLTPVLLALMVSGLLLVYPRAILAFIDVPGPQMNMASDVRVVGILGLIVAVLTLLVSWHPRRWRGFISRVAYWTVAIDVVVTLVVCTSGLISGRVNAEPSRSAAVAQLSANGRYALISTSGINWDAFYNLGSPNMNVFTGLPSVQGYGSLVASNYGSATTTHSMFDLNPCHLSDGLYASLRLKTIAVGVDEFQSNPNDVTNFVWCQPLSSSLQETRYFGQVANVDRVTIDGSSAGGSLAVQLFNGAGVPVGDVERAPASSIVTFNFHGERAAGFRVVNSVAQRGQQMLMAPVGGALVSLETPYQHALEDSRWTLRATSATYAVFDYPTLLPMMWIAPHAAAAVVTKESTAAWGDSWATVTSSSTTTLVRSFSWLPGWRATAVNTTSGRTVALSVQRRGLIQSVDVPAGTWRVHFHYHAPYIELALILSAVGWASMLMAVIVVRRHRRTLK
jgi:hypothetical protein